MNHQVRLVFETVTSNFPRNGEVDKCQGGVVNVKDVFNRVVKMFLKVELENLSRRALL